MELQFERGQSSAQDIQAVVDTVLRELRQPDSESARQTRAAGLDPNELAAASISVTENRQGIAPLIITIIVAVGGPVAAHTINKFLDDIVWPRLKRDRGAMAIGNQK